MQEIMLATVHTVVDSKARSDTFFIYFFFFIVFFSGLTSSEYCCVLQTPMVIDDVQIQKAVNFRKLFPPKNTKKGGTNNVEILDFTKYDTLTHTKVLV